MVGPSGADDEADSDGETVTVELSVGVGVGVADSVAVFDGVPEGVKLALEVPDGEEPQPVTLGMASGPVVIATTSEPQSAACAKCMFWLSQSNTA